MSEVKNSTDGTDSRLNTTEEKVSDTEAQTLQNEAEGEIQKYMKSASLGALCHMI